MEIITKNNFDLKPNSFLLVNKPEGWTSFDVVNHLRKILYQKYPETKKWRVGHAGTLDPFATGLLIVALGREATRKIDAFKNLPKTYEAIIKLGEISDTGDKTGNIQVYKIPFLNKMLANLKTKILNHQTPEPTRTHIEKTLNKFIGTYYQIPPMFSAKKIEGQKLYKLARQKKIIKRKPVKVEIFDLKILDYQYPFLKIKVTCSPGTYIRTLAEDIGKKLNIGAYCKELKRLAIGNYILDNAIKLPLNKAN